MNDVSSDSLTGFWHVRSSDKKAGIHRVVWASNALDAVAMVRKETKYTGQLTLYRIFAYGPERKSPARRS